MPKQKLPIFETKPFHTLLGSIHTKIKIWTKMKNVLPGTVSSCGSALAAKSLESSALIAFSK